MTLYSKTSYPAPFIDEKELLQRIGYGDERAFRVLFDQYHHKLGIYIFRLVKSDELAQEVVQDVFLKIWTNRFSLAEINNFQAYLSVIAKNHALNCLKKLAAEQALIAPLDAWEYDLQSDEAGDETDRYRLMDQAIDRLPKQQKIVYLLSRHERLQYAEIARRLSISQKTVKKYLQISTESITCYIRKSLNISMLFIMFNFFRT
ncbi:RNA polymerase sigma-70 factor, ECF subfamily [Dyadobacter soli]|uniref:RNA polymerase sigma factor n=1 Tax=Dyadobacter soli TaxID=659014 RepID=A0A1G6VSN9_9BACT|nr:RNA polymerase sigma-70 factor [Dyadobacter soli]SDD56554.1 RNA polymerase sigma-70 factor, ECF subfamily [Dyadobacter soli]